MINPNDLIASSAKAARSVAGRWRYPTLLAAQTAGALVLLWNAVPLYRQVLADPAAHVVRNENLVWGLSSIALLQAGYWISYRIRPTLPRLGNALLGHIILFLARLSFVFATSVFGFLFIMEKPGFHIPVLLCRHPVGSFCPILLYAGIGTFRQSFPKREKPLSGSDPERLPHSTPIKSSPAGSHQSRPNELLTTVNAFDRSSVICAPSASRRSIIPITEVTSSNARE